MTKQTIMDNYAKEQGYEDWEDLIHEQNDLDEVMFEYNKVIDLIQDELKDKIATSSLVRHDFNLLNETSAGESQKRFKGRGADFYEVDINSIVNTENL